MANLINSAEVRETWAPIIESATGINEAEKLAWMSEYCHNHKPYEDAHIMSLGTAGNIYGMGPATLPSVDANGNAVNGSGDKAPTLLPLAMQVAAQTIGLDLVPVVPMAGPMGLLSYLDFVYEGGKIAGTTAPTYVKASAAPNDGRDAIGESRLDGMSIYDVSDVSGTISAAFPDDTNIELVKALEDHIKGFAAADKDGNPFSREAGEQTPDNIMGLSLFSKSVAAETCEVAIANDIKIDKEKVFKNIELSCREHGNHKPSMLQDILLKKQTEIDALNGEVIKIGSSLDIDTPLNSSLFHLIKAKENNY